MSMGTINPGDIFVSNLENIEMYKRISPVIYVLLFIFFFNLNDHLDISGVA